MSDSMRENYLLLLAVLAFLALTLRIFWNMYFNKYCQLRKFSTKDNKTIFCLSTLHNLHLKRWTKYSLEDILTVIKNLKPDTVFIEAREEYFKKFDIVDGAVEMAVVYAYCTENNIPVEFVDWWEYDESYYTKVKTSTTKRDDEINKNISKKMAKLQSGKTSLFIGGRLAVTEQSIRFRKNGFIAQTIPKIKNLFKSLEPFAYPESLSDIWERRAHFYAYEYAEIIHSNKKISEELRNKYPLNNEGFFNWQKRYCLLFNQHNLYL